jgi:intein/homing endonuclease
VWVETLRVTAEHPFWVESRGWTRAADLAPGDRVANPDGTFAAVVSNEYEYHPAGLTVYNFSVYGDHTYFVEDGAGAVVPVWVHNRYNALNGNMKKAGMWGKPAEQAAHVVPVGQFGGRNAVIQRAVRDAQNTIRSRLGPNGLNSFLNGFRGRSGHLGTHTDAYLKEMSTRVVREGAKGKAPLIRELQRLKFDILNGQFVA